MAKNPRWRTTAARVLGSRRPGLAELLAAVHEVNPTPWEIAEHERDERYALKAELQTRLVEEHASALELRRDGELWILGVRGGRDAKHLVPEQLGPRAREWFDDQVSTGAVRGAPTPQAASPARIDNADPVDARFEAGDYEGAAALLRPAAGRDPASARHLLELLIDYLDRPGEAIRAYNGWVPGLRERADLTGLAAVAMVRSGEVDRSESLLRGLEADALGPAWQAIGAARVQARDVEGARRAAARLDAAGPAFRTAAEALRRQALEVVRDGLATTVAELEEARCAGDLDRSEAVARSILERDPTHRGAREALTEATGLRAMAHAEELRVKGERLARAGRWREAARAFQEAADSGDHQARSLAEGAARHADEEDARRRLDAVRATLREGSDEWLRAYVDLSEEQRSSIRSEVAGPVLEWLDGLAAVRDPATRVEAARALVVASEAYASGRPELVVRALEPHLPAVERCRAARELLAAAREALSSRRRDEALLALGAAEAAFAQGAMSEAARRMAAVRPKALDPAAKARLVALQEGVRASAEERGRIAVWERTLSDDPLGALSVAAAKRDDDAWEDRRRQAREAARVRLRVQDLLLDGPTSDLRAPRSRVSPHVALDLASGVGWLLESHRGQVLLEQVHLGGRAAQRRAFAFVDERDGHGATEVHVVDEGRVWLRGGRRTWRLDLESGSVEEAVGDGALGHDVAPSATGTWRTATYRKWWFEQDGARQKGVTGVEKLEVVPGSDDAVIAVEGGLERVEPSGRRRALAIPWARGDALVAVTVHPTDPGGVVLSVHRKGMGKLEVLALSRDERLTTLLTRTTNDPWGIVVCGSAVSGLLFVSDGGVTGRWGLSAHEPDGQERWRIEVAARCALLTDHRGQVAALAVEGAHQLVLLALGSEPPELPALGLPPDTERYTGDCHVTDPTDTDPLTFELEGDDGHLEERVDRLVARRPGDAQHAERVYDAYVSTWPERGIALLERRGIPLTARMRLSAAEQLFHDRDFRAAADQLEAADPASLGPLAERHAHHLLGEARLELGDRAGARTALAAALAAPAPTEGECTVQRTVAWLDLLDATDAGRAAPERWVRIREALARARAALVPSAARAELEEPVVARCNHFDVAAERARAVLADPAVPFWPRLRALARVSWERFDPPLPLDRHEQARTCAEARAWLAGPATETPSRTACLALAEELGELVVRPSLQVVRPADRVVRSDPTWARAETARVEAALGSPELRLHGEEAWRFLGERLPGLAQRFEVLAEHRLTRVVEATIQVDRDGDLPSVRLLSEAGPVDADLAITAWLQGRHFVEVDERTVARLPEAWMSRFAEEARDLRAALEAGDPSPVAPLLAERWGALREAERPVPVGLRATLREYQLEGFRWLARRRDAGIGACLADEMGLGKTVQALALLLDTALRVKPGPFLVVSPASLLAGWRQEMDRFTPELARRRVVHHGSGRATTPYGGYVVVLTTYEMLRADASLFAGTRWAAVVFDEAQRLRNPESRTATAARGLDATFRLAITGTPLENRVEDLAGVLGVAVPGVLGTSTLARLRREAAGPPELAAAVGRRVGPILLRRHKRDVAKDLPPVQQVDVPVDLSEAERELYGKLVASVRAAIAEAVARGEPPSVALTAVTRLRQAACDPALLGIVDPGIRSSKIATLAALVSSATESGHRALVFSSFRQLLDRAAAALDELGIRHLRLDGDTPLRERERVAREMGAPEGAPVCLLTYGAGGVGLNLIGADHVILLDPWWNPAVEGQAIDRAHRIGQTRPVMVHRLIAVGTIDEQVRDLQEAKRALFHAAMSGAAAVRELVHLLGS